MILETHELIDVVQKLYPVAQFFKDRYFPDGMSYYSEKALIEMKKKGRRIAPFVVPVVNGITMDSDKYQAHEVNAPYIIPKKSITPKDLAQKAFGEDPNSGRKPSDRADELQAEYTDDIRLAIMRRWELMCTEVVLNGQIHMKQFSNAEDAAKDQNFTEAFLKYYDKTFQNRYQFAKPWKSMTAEEKVKELYKVSAILRKRGVRLTDLVMTSDVAIDLMADRKFLEYYKYNKVDIGTVKPEELPNGVVFSGTINVNGVLLNMFTYDSIFEDLDGKEKEFLPAGTICFLAPDMGKTVYAQVTFLEEDDVWNSYAEPIVMRYVSDRKNNVQEMQGFSRPVMYPLDPEGWLVANIYDTAATDPNGTEDAEGTEDELSTHAQEEPEFKTEQEINAMRTKAELMEYAESIGLTGLDKNANMDELKNAILNYQEELEELGGENV